jgi:prephenate dehydrogenase
MPAQAGIQSRLQTPLRDALAPGRRRGDGSEGAGGRERAVTVTIGILGYGHFGRFLHRMATRFLPEAVVRVHSSRGTPGDGVFATLEETAASDYLLLSVPIPAYEETLARIRPLLGAETVVIDVATVKLHTGNAIRTLLPGQPYVCTHPMFGPESYAKKGDSVDGLRVVVTESNLPAARLDPFWARMRDAGFQVVETTADRHDRDLAETLFLTHYVAQVIAHGGFERTEIDTVSFGFLMDAVDAVRRDAQLFSDVFRFNPHCRDVVRRFDRSERAVKETLLKLPDEAGD